MCKSELIIVTNEIDLYYTTPRVASPHFDTATPPVRLLRVAAEAEQTDTERDSMTGCCLTPARSYRSIVSFLSSQLVDDMI